MGLFTADIGCRVFVEGEYGTVLYIGPIEGVEGTWLGIEWDNVSRGKHSGSYNNVAYFVTKTPNAGSFVKVLKADLGIAFPKALKMKYGHENTSHTPNYINLPQKKGPERHVEMIGMKKIMGKQSNFTRLTDVVLSGMLINSSGDSGELKEMIPNVIYLDLSENLLSSWEAVHEIVSQLTHLTTLILSKNRLKIPERLEYQECYKVLKTLVINYMSYSWTEVLTCAIMWPDIEELSVQDNNISFLENPSIPVFSKLKCLSLDNNPINSWMQICKLGKLLSLKELHLDNTSLESITFPDTSPLEKTDLFPNLEILFLRDNKLEKWQDISELNKLNQLKSLMISNNPVNTSLNPETARQHIIAKILGLEKLSRNKIERSERNGAEYDYIKRFYKEWLADDCSKNGIQNSPFSTFLKLHPTFPLLLQKYGAPDANEVESQSTLIKDNLISVQFFSPLIANKSPLAKKLPGEMTIGKLRALAKRMFKVTTPEVKLTLIYNEDNSQKTDLDNNLRQLSFYSLSGKDKILVEW